MARIVLGVSGGIAAYKACSLLRLFTEAGHDVTVVPTAVRAALRRRAHVGGAVRQAGAHRGLDDVHEVPHVRLGQPADLVVVAPATADLLARAAHGLADDLLTNVLLTARCPVVMAPAMHTEMWEHPATQANVATLAERGVHIIPPASGRLTGADTGPGRLPEPEDLYAVCERILRPLRPRRAEPAPLAAATLGIRAGRPRDRRAGRAHGSSSRAGGTREPLDPVRFLGNRCSGKQGYALAAVAAAPRRRGDPASPPTPRCPPPHGVDVVAGRDRAASCRQAVERGRQGRRRRRHGGRGGRLPAGALRRRQDQEDARRRGRRAGRAAPTIELVRNPDILAGLVEARGEAAEPGDRRLRRRDRRRRRARCSTTAATSWPARAATCSSSTRSAPTRPSARTTTPSTSCARAPSHVDRRRPGLQGRRSPPQCGTPSRRSSDLGTLSGSRGHVAAATRQHRQLRCSKEI